MSGYGRPEENTLGVVIGKRGRPKPTSSPAARALRQASAGGASLGTGYLGIGAGIIAVIVGIAGLAVFLTRLDSYPSPLPVAFAWLLYCLLLIVVGVTIALAGERMPNWLFALYLAALACVIALDFIAIWPLHDIGGTATASVVASSGLLVAVTLRRASEILIAVGLIGVAFIVAIAVTTPLTTQTLPAQLVVLAAVILPPTFATWLVVNFRRIVQLELDRVLVQSTVSAPRFAVGMMASEELARLDLAAEELFDSVASGRTKLPLDPKTASIAASLATELRLHLIEGRRETWLYHAITESEQLGKSVTLSDTGSLAGLLDPQQRDGLLSGVWLLVSDKSNDRTTVHLTLGPAGSVDAEGAQNAVLVPIVITTTGVARNRVDPATWGSLARVGTFTNAMENSSLRVQIECLVTNPADQYHAEQAVHR
ncbi:hypothetical protein BKA04_002168 [Cryobacterium mesophilum]|uniref:Uncharacterized protein n=1 Tax=Terrimesophilobacter mesophilus TaxID=433647 RepID=A0A4R8VEK5_9MICO|nr:hypothetical protein [Terrimesophilobacter mesophilus]MBB5633945.1 hypothetical protein [Terrimesophilobacter mesophilus]TFB80610.1 hypothetical protein E3N84_11555 [Terrimesophilobacter mesophilus]